MQMALSSSIMVYPLSADLTFNNRFQDVQVQNSGSDIAYVAISIYRVNHPGMPDQSFTMLEDNPYQVGLIVTPSKMIIPAGQFRIARILYIGKPVTSDVAYEVKFTPVAGALVPVGNSTLSAGIELVVAYGVSILVRPVNLSPHLIATREGKALSLQNTGNTTVTLENCLPDKNLIAQLYPGNTFHYTLTTASPQTCVEEVLQEQFSSFKIN